MEWGLARFDSFVPDMPESGQEEAIPRALPTYARHLCVLGVTATQFCLCEQTYHRNGEFPLSADTRYLVLTPQQEKWAQDIGDGPLDIITLTDFLPSLAIPKSFRNAADQHDWLRTTLEYLQNDLRADPAIFDTAQKAWRHHARRRIARDWKLFDVQQNQFWFTYEHGAFSEAFMLSEARANRTVIASDIRSAYGWAMVTQTYPAPGTWLQVDDLPPHDTPFIALCKLSKPSKWLSRHHPWRYCELGSAMPFYWHKEDTVAGWFTNFELQAIQGLCHIETIEIWSPPKYGPHPMANQIAHWFEQRNSNLGFASCWKTKIASAHSWLTKYALQTVGEADLELTCADRFTARPSQNGKRHFFTKYDSKLGKINYIHKGANAGVWLPSVWTALLVRSRIFSIMRWVHENLPQAQCAYVNVDAIHWTMPSEYTSEFTNKLSNSIWCHTDIGGLRIEHIGTGGIWLRAGSYTIWNQGRIEITTLGDNPWNIEQPKTFWARDWQALFPLSGSARACWYQRPADEIVWTETKSSLTANLVKTLRWKQAAWNVCQERYMQNNPVFDSEQ